MRRKGRKTQGRGWYDMFSENCKVQGEKLFEGPHNDIKTKALCLLPVRFSLDGVPPLPVVALPPALRGYI